MKSHLVALVSKNLYTMWFFFAAMTLKKSIPLICVLVIEIEAQFFNDPNTQVWRQIARPGINDPRGKLHFLEKTVV